MHSAKALAFRSRPSITSLACRPEQQEDTTKQMSYLGDLYKAERRAQSASMIYQEPVTPVQRPAIYTNAPVRTLGDYASATVASRYEPKSGESDHGYVARLTPLLRHLAESLPADELERVAAAYKSAVARLEGGTQTHAELREHLDANGPDQRGLFGISSPQERAAALGNRGFGSGRQVEANGHLADAGHVTPGQGVPPMSAARAMQIVRQREAEVRGQLPQHTDASQLRSTGAGFMGVDR